MNNRRSERRAASAASRDEMEAALTELQRLTLNRVCSHGWRLQFVRQGPDAEATAVVHDLKSGNLAVIGPDGSLDMQPGLRFRRD